LTAQSGHGSTRAGRFVRSVVPRRVINLLRRLGVDWLVAQAAQFRALYRVPRVPCDPSNLRQCLDLAQVFGSIDPQISALVASAGLPEDAAGVNPGDRQAISALVAYLQPRTVLEVGTHIGSSTIALASTLSGSARITTVDIMDVNDPSGRPWERYGAQRSPAEIVHGLVPVKFVVSDSLSYLANTGERYDFIFLDGDHRAETLYQELPLALSRLKPEGLILLHDYFPGGRPLWRRRAPITGPYLACRRLKREGAAISIQPLGALPWPTKLGSHMTSLALVLAA
jgi:predicted O-methyltransferase YrrM